MPREAVRNPRPRSCRRRRSFRSIEQSGSGIFRLIAGGSERAGNREEGRAPRATAARHPPTTLCYLPTTAHDQQAASMNQLEVPFGRDPRELLAGSAAGTSLPPPAPSSVKTAKHNGPEIDQDDDEQSQQRQDSELSGGHDGDYSGNNQGAALGTACEPMVTYDGFESVGKPFGSAARFGLGDDDDDDVVNIRSPIVCKPSGSRSSRAMSPTCVSALARDAVENDREDDLEEPSWSIQEFQEYLGMLELLQEACSNSEEMSLSADSLSQMERLLTALLPQGA
jgi:hypothetical protein